MHVCRTLWPGRRRQGGKVFTVLGFLTSTINALFSEPPATCCAPSNSGVRDGMSKRHVADPACLIPPERLLCIESCPSFSAGVLHRRGGQGDQRERLPGHRAHAAHTAAGGQQHAAGGARVLACGVWGTCISSRGEGAAGGTVPTLHVYNRDRCGTCVDNKGEGAAVAPRPKTPASPSQHGSIPEACATSAPTASSSRVLNCLRELPALIHKLLPSPTQVHPGGLRHIRPDRRINEWKVPGRRNIKAAASNEKQVGGAMCISSGSVLAGGMCIGSGMGLLVCTAARLGGRATRRRPATRRSGAGSGCVGRGCVFNVHPYRYELPSRCAVIHGQHIIWKIRCQSGRSLSRHCRAVLHLY